MDIMRSVVGMVVLLAIAFLLSVNKKSISLRTVGAALLLQIAIGGIMLYFPPGKWAVEQAALGVHKVMSYSDAGSAFIFGSLVGPKMDVLFDGAGFIFAFRVLPAIIFVVGCFLAFATGTSWGTFGILIPIVVAVFENSNPDLMIISISACMAGAVCGDHCSPISDTTIMASAGAQCEHVNHVTTQLPYAVTAAAVSFVSYIIAGFVQSAWIALPIAIALMVATMFVIRAVNGVLKEEA